VALGSVLTEVAVWLAEIPVVVGEAAVGVADAVPVWVSVAAAVWVVVTTIGVFVAAIGVIVLAVASACAVSTIMVGILDTSIVGMVGGTFRTRVEQPDKKIKLNNKKTVTFFMLQSSCIF
jgi:hypothetical protein